MENKLDSFGWFAIISGSIGLIADITSLATLFFIGRDLPNTSLIVIWVIIGILLIYVTLVLGILFRKLICMNHFRLSSVISSADFSRFEMASSWFIVLIVTPVWMALLLNIVWTFKQNFGSDFAGAAASTLIFTAVFGGLGNFGLSAAIGMIYSACDPRYKISE
ncbi:MAG: hypothetical protein A2Y07_03330 [Planctomycetes bacterium GWF2_50_10]|nr:MAG: hypothetical protein A2Y07_03330 [Planctomycetes bacterium GWF2_50_10]